MKPLVVIKTVHTIIWIFYNVVIFYLLYAVIVNKIDIWAWICVGLVFAEVLVLVLFKWFCPLTVIARKYSNSAKPNFDIYLPEWLAKYNKHIYSVIFCVSLIVLIFRII